MQIRQAVKKFRMSIYYTKTFYCLYISKMYFFCLFMWAACGSYVIVIYDVIEH